MDLNQDFPIKSGTLNLFEFCFPIKFIKYLFF